MTIAIHESLNMSFEDVATGNLLAPVHPGSVLLADFIEPMGLTGRWVSEAMGVEPQYVDEICAEKRGITVDIAESLGRAFNIDPRFWINLQAQYEIDGS